MSRRRQTGAILRRLSFLLAALFVLSAGTPSAATPLPLPAAESSASGAPGKAVGAGAEASSGTNPLADDDFELEFEETSLGFSDPLEGLNRRFLWFNRKVDDWVMDPVTHVYSMILPDPARKSIRNAFANLRSPSVFVNDTIQLEFKDAGITLGRFALNSTVGLAGLFDPAKGLGLPPHYSDFGQTLALAGAGAGPYLVVPILGPTTARDAVGDVVDLLFRPTFYILGPAQQLVYGGSSGFVSREEYQESMNRLEASSTDFYAALRNAYYQDRTAAIWGRREDRRPKSARRVVPGAMPGPDVTPGAGD